MANKCSQLKVILPRNRIRYSRACKMPGGAVRNGKCIPNIFVGEQEKIVPGKLADESQLGGLSRLLEIKPDENLTNLSFNNTSKNPTDILVNQHQNLQQGDTETQNNTIFDRCKAENPISNIRTVISRLNGDVIKSTEPPNRTVGRSKPSFDSPGTGTHRTAKRRKNTLIRLKCSLSEEPDDNTRNSSPEEHLKVSGEVSILNNLETSVLQHPKPLKKRYRDIYSNELLEKEGGMEEELGVTNGRLESPLPEEASGERDDTLRLKRWSPRLEEAPTGERRVTRARACKGLRYQQFMFTEAALPRKKQNRKQKDKDTVRNFLTEKTAVNHTLLDLPPPPSDPESDEQMEEVKDENGGKWIKKKGGINSVNYKETKYNNNINNNNNSVMVNINGVGSQDEFPVGGGLIQRERSQSIKKVDLDSSDFTDASLFPLAALATVAAAEHDQRMASRLAAASHPF